MNKSNEVVIIHNVDFNLEAVNLSDEPPSSKDNHFYPGDEARAGVQKVARSVYETLSGLGYKKVSIVPIQTLEDVRYLTLNNVDLVFNLCESLAADPYLEAEVVRILEEKQLSFTGNNSTSLHNCLNKYRSSRRLQEEGVNIPKSFLVVPSVDLLQIREQITPGQRYIIKPNSEDGSIAIDSNAVVDNVDDLINQCLKLQSMGIQDIIVQEYIAGREFNVAILNRAKKKYAISEIIFENTADDRPKILDYAAKWNEDSTEFKASWSVPASIGQKLRKRLLESAIKAGEVLDINSYARFDFRVDHKGQPYLIDINPNCDLDPNAGFSKSFANKNIKYGQVLKQIMINAVENHKVSLKNRFAWPLPSETSVHAVPLSAQAGSNYEY